MLWIPSSNDFLDAFKEFGYTESGDAAPLPLPAANATDLMDEELEEMLPGETARLHPRACLFFIS